MHIYAYEHICTRMHCLRSTLVWWSSSRHHLASACNRESHLCCTPTASFGYLRRAPRMVRVGNTVLKPSAFAILVLSMRFWRSILHQYGATSSQAHGPRKRQQVMSPCMGTSLTWRRGVVSGSAGTPRGCGTHMTVLSDTKYL